MKCEPMRSIEPRSKHGHAIRDPVSGIDEPHDIPQLGLTHVDRAVGPHDHKPRVGHMRERRDAKPRRGMQRIAGESSMPHRHPRAEERGHDPQARYDAHPTHFRSPVRVLVQMTIVSHDWPGFAYSAGVSTSLYTSTASTSFGCMKSLMSPGVASEYGVPSTT